MIKKMNIECRIWNLDTKNKMLKIPNSEFQILNSKKGQSLMEVLVAVGLAAVFLTGAVLLITAFLSSNKKNREIQTAIDLAAELTESVRTLSNQSWNNIYLLNKGESNHYYVTTTPDFATSSGEQIVEIHNIQYTRWFYVNNVFRNALGDIEPGPSLAEDPGTQLIRVRITWPGNLTGMYFSEYLTRSRNQIFRQTDWSGGPEQENFPGSGVNHKFATSTPSQIVYDGTGGSLLAVVSGGATAQLTSSVFDTGIVSGAQLNSIMWRGMLGVSSNVKFQIASSNCFNGSTNPPACNTGAWQYFGPDADPTGYYSTSGPKVTTKISLQDHNNKRYFRYKIFMSYTIGGSSPQVDDVIINYSL